jgi:hypothetical protein
VYRTTRNLFCPDHHQFSSTVALALAFCDVDTVTSNAAKFDGHRSWASKEYYRNEMVRKIEALGVNATYFNPGEYAAMGSEILSAGMWTLAITIPPAQPKTKRRRLMNEQ